jgi:signal transduction histidine kinase
MRFGLARMVGALRCAVATLAVAGAVVGAVPSVSWAWLAPAIVLVLVWTPVYAVVAWTAGLKPWLVGADLAVAAALALAAGHLEPTTLPSMLGWVASLVSVAIVSAQLGGAPQVSVPAALLVVACYLAGQRIAGSPDHGTTALLIMAVQILLGAAVMAVAMRAEREAVRSFLGLQEAQAAADLARIRREDERAQLRMVHNGPLTTLTMALHTTGDRPTATLRHRAAAVLDALPALTVVHPPPRDGGEAASVRLDERISQVMVWYAPPLRINADLRPVLVGAAVAEALAAAVSEALENVVRHAGTERVAVRLTEWQDAVLVTVTDHGRGFDYAVVAGSGAGFGLREDLAGRMAAVGGRVTVRSSPGSGTSVELEWRRG